MTKFEEEIMRMGEGRRKDRLEGIVADKPHSGDGISYEIKQTMKKLFNLVDSGVGAYNNGVGRKELSVYELPEEFLKVFLNLPGKRMGFFIIAPQKFVVFLDEKPDQVLVLGKKRQNERGVENGLTGVRQLIKITCLRSGNGLVFRDNTGATLEIEDIVMHIIRWLVSE
ncbi:MAG TPA: hypothetical protein VHT73_18025 [Thermodesulfobacteriota bacterium]|nr:hypothetical protein [Thermodesulfobacteriota bacterium]